MLKEFFSSLLRIYFPKKRELSFTVNINYNEFLRYYKGEAQTVRLKTDNGQIIVFPAAKLRPFVDHTGIRGRFVIAFDKKNKFISIKRI